MNTYENPAGYLPYADITTIALCIVCMIVLKSSYLSKKKTSSVFVACTLLLFLVSCIRVVTYAIENTYVFHTDVIYAILYYVTYFIFALLLALFNQYLYDLIDMKGKMATAFKYLVWPSFGLFGVLMCAVPTIHALKLGYLSKSVFQRDCVRIFSFSYCFLGFWLFLILFFSKKRFITRINQSFLAVMVLSIAMIFIQARHHISSYTSVTYALPLFIALYWFHYSTYDVDTGTMDAKTFNAYVSDLKGKDFTLICLYLKNMYTYRKDELVLDFFHFNEKFFSNPVTFRLRDEKMVLIIKDDENPNREKQIAELLNDFQELYYKYRIDYKTVLIHSNPQLQDGDAYLSYNQYLEKNMAINAVHKETKEDLDHFLKDQYILKELHDIFVTKDKNDPRILVYCQPVYSNKTHKFSTAEALMRLKLDNIGLVFPDQFIPLAEEHEYIHVMSMIILNKTCQQVKKLLEDGKEITRISVNFNITELLLPDFSKEVKETIESNRIPFDKIAIELTEGQKEKDFDVIKAVMLELGELGIKFYLDDFGTSYSNFERIMELPFDIIKFDRSMTMMAAKGGNAEKIVGSMASIFRDTNFRILFEGIEDDSDENRCIGMGAQFLQGYKYSKPIPIEQLGAFCNDADK